MKKPLNTDERWVIIGQLGAPHGVKGWIKLNSFTQPIGNILDYQPWFVEKKNQWEALEYEKVEFHTKGIIVLLKGISDRDTVATCTLANVAIPRSKLPTLSDEYYWSDLEGLNVVTKEDFLLGRVDHLFETGSNDVLVVKGEREHLIPYLMQKTILNIDLEKKLITVDWDPEF